MIKFEDFIMSDVFIIEEMIGKTFVSVIQRGDDELIFVDAEGNACVFYHDQDCCESVTIEDIVGDLADLQNSEIVEAECVTDEHPTDYANEVYESYTWTFYKFRTKKGCVTVKWCGLSNGYYSESVNFKTMTKEELNSLMRI